MFPAKPSAILCIALVLLLQACALRRPAAPCIVYASATADLTGGGAPTFSVGAFNLHGLTDPQGLARTLAALDFVDVWAFQEVNGPIRGEDDAVAFHPCDPPDRLLEILPSGRWNVFTVPMNRVDGGRVWEGMAVASKRPIASTEIWPLRATGPKRRGALSCLISLDDVSRVLIVNTDHEVGMLSVTPSDRKQQVDDLCAFIQEVDPPDVPIVLLGDFNTVGIPLLPFLTGPRDEISALRSSLRTAGLQPLPQSGRPCNTFRKFFFSRALDHIFTRDVRRLQWGVTESYLGSDHRPLWMTSRLEEEDARGAQRSE